LHNVRLDADYYTCCDFYSYCGYCYSCSRCSRCACCPCSSFYNTSSSRYLRFYRCGFYSRCSRRPRFYRCCCSCSYSQQFQVKTLWFSSRCSGCAASRNIKTSTPLFLPIYLSHEISYIKSENGVGFAAEFSTQWLLSIYFSRAWERRVALRNHGDWCSCNHEACSQSASRNHGDGPRCSYIDILGQLISQHASPHDVDIITLS
jgi:hypothetical protein